MYKWTTNICFSFIDHNLLELFKIKNFFNFSSVLATMDVQCYFKGFMFLLFVGKKLSSNPMREISTYVYANSALIY